MRTTYASLLWPSTRRDSTTAGDRSRDMLPEALISFFCVEKDPGLRLETFQRSVPVGRASLLCLKQVQTKRKLSSWSRACIRFFIIVSSWSTSDSTTRLQNGTAYACLYRGQSTRQWYRSEKVHDRCALHWAGNREEQRGETSAL